jgi:hypothetical protein
MFTSSGLTASGFTLTATGLSANALVAGFGIYSDQGLEGTVSIDGELVNFSGQGENVIFAGGDFFGDENVSIDSGAFTDIAIVPLPQAVGLAGAGIALMGLRRRRAL